MKLTRRWMAVALVSNLLGGILLFFSFQIEPSHFKLVRGDGQTTAICVDGRAVMLADGGAYTLGGGIPCPGWNSAKSTAEIHVQRRSFVYLGFVLTIIGFLMQLSYAWIQPNREAAQSATERSLNVTGEAKGKIEMSDAALSQLAENHRFYGDMRFKQLTLFMAAMTAAAAGVIQAPNTRWWIAISALFVTAVMWVIEVRASLNGIVAREAIPQLFPRTREWFWPWINTTWAVLSLHVGFYILWLACIRIWRTPDVPALRDVTFWIAVTIGSMLLIFSIVNYWRNRTFWLNSGERTSS